MASIERRVAALEEALASLSAAAQPEVETSKPKAPAKRTATRKYETASLDKE